MTQKVRGIVARAKGQPVSLETIVIPDPGPGEAEVRPGEHAEDTEDYGEARYFGHLAYEVDDI